MVYRPRSGRCEVLCMLVLGLFSYMWCIGMCMEYAQVRVAHSIWNQLFGVKRLHNTNQVSLADSHCTSGYRGEILC